MLQEEQYLRAVQAALLKGLRGLLGTSYDDPIIRIKYVIDSVYEQNLCCGLFIYGDKERSTPTEQDVLYTFVVRIGHDHCKSAHYLYGKVEMERCAGKWLIHSVTVSYRPVPEKYMTCDAIYGTNFSNIRYAFDKVHLQIRSARGLVDTLDYDGTISRTLEFLTSEISSIWDFTKWHEPWTTRESFINSGLVSILGYEHYKKVRFKEGEHGELVIEFYYKGERILVHKIHLSESLEDLLQS